MEIIQKNHKENGQAMLPVLMIMIIVLFLGVGILHLSIGGLLISASSGEGEKILIATEGALENGLLRILRSPTYSGESLPVGGIPCTISVSGTSPKVMVARCASQRAVRQLQAEVSFIQGEMIVSDYKEIE